MSRVVVTGAAGYIGGQTVLTLLDLGHSVFAIDRMAVPEHLEHCGAKWMQSDFADHMALTAISKFRPDAVVHCAGTSLVGPSIANPAEYYNNNFVKTKALLEFLLTFEHRPRLVFSSSAATYGNPIMTPCEEVDPTEPISPYGESKLMIDWMLKSYHHAYGLDFVSFRYFNACGADPQARHGQAPGATHIIARVLESMRDQKTFTLYGTDYPTPDGTCVRDYIHVADLAKAHVMAIDPTIPTGIYNLGTNVGTSNAEVIDTARIITGKTIDVTTGNSREGDPAILTADANKFMAVSSWKPQYNLKNIIADAWAWYNR
jgi:UDP-glucose 4-epimerase